MGGTTGRRRRSHSIQYLHEMIHSRETEYSDPIGAPSFAINHGTTDCIGMSQILYCREVTSVPVETL